MTLTNSGGDAPEERAPRPRPNRFSFAIDFGKRRLWSARSALTVRRLLRGPGGSRSPRHGLPALAALFVLFVGLTWTEQASAYAWMIRHDYAGCGTCHADPSGGGLLTNYGRVTSDLILRTHYSKKSEAEETPDAGALWGLLDLPDSLLLSGAFRNLVVLSPGSDDPFAFVPVMQADLYGQLRLGRFTVGGSIGIAKVPQGSTNARPAQVTTDQGDGLNMIARTFYMGLDIGKDFVLRGGRLNLPFGVRIPEHNAWVREATRTDRESDQQDGLALAYTSENLRAEVMAIAGNYQIQLDPGSGPYKDFSPDAVRARGYSLYVEGLGSTSFAAGVSSKVTYARLDRLTFEQDSVRQAHGMTLRWAASEKFSILGEMDALFRSRANAGYVGFAQADYEPIQGLHLMLTGEVVDQGMAQQTADESAPVAQPGSGEPAFGGWFTVDWFFYKQLEFRTDFVLRQDEPFTILGQFHFYL